MPDVTVAPTEDGGRRWLILAVVGLAQLMVILDLTVMNIALPSALSALTQYLSWRWCLYVNLLFAGMAFIGERCCSMSPQPG
jgi:hypothetical protein